MRPLREDSWRAFGLGGPTVIYEFFYPCPTEDLDLVLREGLHRAENTSGFPLTQEPTEDDESYTVLRIELDSPFTKAAGIENLDDYWDPYVEKCQYICNADIPPECLSIWGRRV